MMAVRHRTLSQDDYYRTLAALQGSTVQLVSVDRETQSEDSKFTLDVRELQALVDFVREHGWKVE